MIKKPERIRATAERENAKAVERIRQRVERDKARVAARSKVDVLGLCCTIVQLLDDLCTEVGYATPSHSWHNMREIREKIQTLRAELEDLARHD